MQNLKHVPIINNNNDDNSLKNVFSNKCRRKKNETVGLHATFLTKKISREKQ